MKHPRKKRPLFHTRTIAVPLRVVKGFIRSLRQGCCSIAIAAFRKGAAHGEFHYAPFIRVRVCVAALGEPDEEFRESPSGLNEAHAIEQQGEFVSSNAGKEIFFTD